MTLEDAITPEDPPAEEARPELPPVDEDEDDDDEDDDDDDDEPVQPTITTSENAAAPRPSLTNVMCVSPRNVWMTHRSFGGWASMRACTPQRRCSH